MKKLLGALLVTPILAADTGSITGRFDQPAAVTAISAVERKMDGRKFAGRVDPVTGEFVIAGLPLATTLDCIVEVGDGARLEGVDFHVPRSDYEEEQPLAAEDVETIRQQALALNKFEDVVEVMAIEGNIQHAAVLVNKLRTTPFINSQPGEVIWRVELWHFERPEETWVKVQDELFVVLYRERIPRSAFDKKSVTFDPRLGGLRLSAERPKMDLGEIKLPPPTPGVRLRKE